MEYAAVAWCGVGSSDIERLERVQRAAARLIAKGSVTGRLPRDLLLARAGLEPVQQRRRLHCGVFAYDPTSTSRRGVPLHLAHLFEHWQARVPTSTSALVLRSAASGRYRLPQPCTEVFRHSPLYYCLSVLNTVPSDHLSSLSLLKSFLSGFLDLLVVLVNYFFFIYFVLFLCFLSSPPPCLPRHNFFSAVALALYISL